MAFVLKAMLTKFKTDIVQKFKTAALKEGRGVTYKMGPREFMEVIVPAVAEFKAKAEKEDLFVMSLRRNDMLAYGCFSGKFEKITAEISPWVVTVGDLGGHRYPKAWLEDRFSWLVEGVPELPQWQEVLTRQEQRDHEVAACEAKKAAEGLDGESGWVSE